jgi:hypothetical protein
MDPFSGSGTVASVAIGHGRHALAVDISAEYLEGLTPGRVGSLFTWAENGNGAHPA